VLSAPSPRANVEAKLQSLAFISLPPSDNNVAEIEKRQPAAAGVSRLN
jgi:hypothetical protein